ncbi:MFS transporter [Sphingobium fuliginis]|uniref:MFS transporter n=1 Tax=Sphingobium fuliginis ATCC 27551 TaxID=1208342 RepID=A0A5B8CP21_SPHSA|nr:MFS transporter [Sphingobium fuliginis]QDC40418.1 MFS transporter [Sphingobium fuliginis ATCC 27551]
MNYSSSDAPAGLKAKRKGWVIALCFLVVLLDGFDTTAIAFVAPVLAKQWGLAPSAFTAAFVATSSGAVIGYLLSGPLTRAIGLKKAGTAAITVLSAGTFLTAFVPNIEVLALLRLLTSVGLGAAVPVMVSTATAGLTERNREIVAMLVVTGISGGAALGGLLGAPLIRNHGWQTIFYVGGLLPALLIPTLSTLLSSSGAPKGPASSVGLYLLLFKDGLAARTLLIWTFSFLLFMCFYALSFWAPTFLLQFGFPADRTALGTAFLGLGGVLGNTVIMLLLSRVRMGHTWAPLQGPRSAAPQ